MNTAVVTAEEFDVELIGAPVKATLARAESTRTDMFMVPWRKLQIMDGFNVRTDSQDNKNHIDALAQSMIQNGFYRDKPITVFAGKDADNEDTLFVTDGHCRLAAVALAVKAGAEIERVPVLLKPAETTLADLTAALANGNNGKPLAPLELAAVCKRLLSYGVAEGDVAKRVGITPKYLGDLRALAGAPASIRKAVEKGNLSATEAVKQIREKGVKAPAAIEEGIKKAEAAGKTRVTNKHIDGPAKEKKERKARKSKDEPVGTEIAPGRTEVRAFGSDNYEDRCVLIKGQKCSFAAVSRFTSLAAGDWWQYTETPGEIEATDDIQILVKISRNQPRVVEADATDGL